MRTVRQTSVASRRFLSRVYDVQIQISVERIQSETLYTLSPEYGRETWFPTKRDGRKPSRSESICFEENERSCKNPGWRGKTPERRKTVEPVPNIRNLLIPKRTEWGRINLTESRPIGRLERDLEEESEADGPCEDDLMRVDESAMTEDAEDLAGAVKRLQNV